MPPQLPGITRVNLLRVLSVTLTRRLSASEHIRQVISDCSQSLYELRVLHHHGTIDVGLCTVFRSVVVAKIVYACSKSSGFIMAFDHYHIDVFLRRSKQCGFCQPDLPSFNQLVEDSEDRLFNKLCNSIGHTYTTVSHHQYGNRTLQSLFCFMTQQSVTCTYRPTD